MSENLEFNYSSEKTSTLKELVEIEAENFEKIAGLARQEFDAERRLAAEKRLAAMKTISKVAANLVESEN